MKRLKWKLTSRRQNECMTRLFHRHHRTNQAGKRANENRFGLPDKKGHSVHLYVAQLGEAQTVCTSSYSQGHQTTTTTYINTQPVVFSVCALI